MSEPQWFQDCVAARRMASKTIAVGSRRFVRFAAMNGPDDGTLRCISCGQIDDPPWHKPELCFAIASLKEPAQ